MRAELEQRLGFCGNLPSLPAVAIRVIELANDPEVRLDEVARVIAMDPALVTKLLRAANSPLYGLRRKATNLRQALNLLGLQGTLVLALGFSLMAPSHGMGTAAVLDTEQFWRRSLLAGTACRILGERLAMKNLEEMFLAGLLHGIGILALATVMPDRYGPLLRDASDHEAEGATALDYDRLVMLERERLQTDHAQVGAWLLRRWGLPDYLAEAVLGSLSPDDADIAEEYRKLARCVALTVRLADIWIRPGYWQHSTRMAESAQQWFGLEASDYVSILEAVGAKFPEIADLFQIEALDPFQVAGLLEQAREVLTIRNVRDWPTALAKRALPENAARPASLPDVLPMKAGSSGAAHGYRDPAFAPASDRQYAFDALTGLFNRQQFEEVLGRELARARSQNWSISVALLSLDDYKQMTRVHGRAASNAIMIALGRLFGSNIRRHDNVARYSDDTFALLLPGCDVQNACRMLERLLALISAWHPVLEGGGSLRPIVFAGLAAYPDTGLADCASTERLLQAADDALSAARRGGPGRLVIYGEGTKISLPQG